MPASSVDMVDNNHQYKMTSSVDIVIHTYPRLCSEDNNHHYTILSPVDSNQKY